MWRQGMGPPGASPTIRQGSCGGTFLERSRSSSGQGAGGEVSNPRRGKGRCLSLSSGSRKTAEGEAGNAEVWSQNMLMLRDARQDLHAGSGPRPALSR